MPISVSKLSRSLSEYLNRAAYGSERIVITSRGTPKAAIISIEDLQRLQDIEDWDRDDRLSDRKGAMTRLAAM